MDTNINQKETHIDSGEVSLKDLFLKIQKWFNYLISNWIVILTFAIIGCIMGFAFSVFQKPIYIATTTFVLEGNERSVGGDLGQYAGLASMVGVDLNGGSGSLFQGDNIFQLYKSRKMIEKTLLTRMNTSGSGETLMQCYIRINNLNNRWKDRPNLLKIDFGVKQAKQKLNKLEQRLKDSVLAKTVNDINKNYLIVAKPDKKLSVIKVDVKAKDELFAKEFNEKIVENVNEFYLQTKTKKSIENINILQHKTDSVRAVMNGAIYNATSIADATPNLNPTRQIQRGAPLQRLQFSAETNKAILSSLVQNLEMTKMTLLKEAPLIQIIDGPVFPLDVQIFGKGFSIILGLFVMTFISIIYLILKKVREYLK